MGMIVQVSNKVIRDIAYLIAYFMMTIYIGIDIPTRIPAISDNKEKNKKQSELLNLLNFNGI